jgi:hypothetical protein
MPRYFDLRSTVLIVVGHGILPEEEDRPLAYDLKREITARANGWEERTAVVVTDVWLMGQELGEFFPAIAIGGPAVNEFTEHIYGFAGASRALGGWGHPGPPGHYGRPRGGMFV